MKRIQNRVAESGITLPVAGVLAALVWLLEGVGTHQLWLQLACFAASIYLIVELNNSHALLRIRSRMVSTVFIMLTCMSSFLFGHLDSGIIQMTLVAFLLILFHTYQNGQAAGKVYYAFLLYGTCTCFFVQLFFLVPILWLLMATQLQAMNGRLWLASLLGLATPYWLGLPVLIGQQDFSPLASHFQDLVTFKPLGEAYKQLTVNEVIVLSFITLLLTIGIIHFWKNSYEDKIRIRLIYGFFTVMSLISILCLLLQPQLIMQMMPLIITFSSPLIAHFFALTDSKLTNILFLVSAFLSVLIIIFNLWMPSLTF